MTSQEIAIQVWRKMFQDMADAVATNVVELNLQKQRADSLQAELDKLKEKKEET